MISAKKASLFKPFRQPEPTRRRLTRGGGVPETLLAPFREFTDVSGAVTAEFRKLDQAMKIREMVSRPPQPLVEALDAAVLAGGTLEKAALECGVKDAIGLLSF